MNLRTTIFTKFNLRPKHHYIVHYPDLIIKFGPLRHLWTLRYESKHRYFKNIVKHSKNYKNVSLMLGEKHQLLQTLLSSQGTFCRTKIISDKCLEYKENNYCKYVNNVVQMCRKFENPKFVSDCATIKGTHYKMHDYVSCYKTDIGTFMLCKILYIIIHK